MSLDPNFYGCTNRPDFVGSYLVQDGWITSDPTRIPRMVSQKTTGQKPCQFTQFQLTPTSPANRDDPRCQGCARRMISQTKGAL